MKQQGNCTQDEVGMTRCHQPPHPLTLCFPTLGSSDSRVRVLQFPGSPGKPHTCLPECHLLPTTGGHRSQAVDAAELLDTLCSPLGAHQNHGGSGRGVSLLGTPRWQRGA